MTGSRRKSLRLKCAALAVLVALLTLLPAGPASAHATLVESSPASGAVVGQAPTEVSLTYDQAVTTNFGSVKVLSPDGTRVDNGQVGTRNGGKTVFATVHAGLPAGTYTILWRVVSADTHTVFGAVTFSVGAQSATAASVAAAAHAVSSGGDAAKQLLVVSRFLLYTGLVLLIGAIGFLVVLWPSGRREPGAVRIPWIGLGLAVFGSVAGLLMQAVYSAGRGLGSSFDPSLIQSVLGTRFGVATIIRLIFLVGMAFVLVGLTRLRRSVLAAAAAVATVGVVASTSAIGHSGTGDLSYLAWPADVLHIVAASAWLGGLVVLAAIVLRRHPADLVEVLPKWSRYAVACVLVLVATGVFAGWRQVRTLDALTDTTYGRLLLVKTGLVVVMLALGAAGRSWVRRHYVLPVMDTHVPTEPPYESASSSADNELRPRGDGGVLLLAQPEVAALAEPLAGNTLTATRPVPTSGAVRRLRRSVLMESAVAIVVLAVTAILVGTTPADESYFPTFAKTATVAADLDVHVKVTPAKLGLDDMYLTYTDPAGKVVDVETVSARWTEEGGSHYVVPVELTRTSLGQYAKTQVEIPGVGTWQLAITTQTSEFDAPITVLEVHIR